MLLRLLCSLLGLILEVVLLLLLLLLLLGVRRTVAEERTRGVWRRVECLVVVGAVRVLAGALLVVLVRRRMLLWLQTLAFGAVVLVYPALSVITSLRAHSSEWGPIVLVLVWIWRILLRMRLLMALELRVLGRHLWLLVLVLQKRVEVVLVVLVRGCEVRAGPVLGLPLVPLGGAQAILLLLLVIESARLALTHRAAASGFGLGGILFLVTGERCTQAAA